MGYKDKIEQSKTADIDMSISEIWSDTTKVEQTGIESCKAYYTWELGYKVAHEPKRYHPEYDILFRFKDDELKIEVKTEPHATGVDNRDVTPWTWATCFVEYMDKTCKHPEKLSGLSLTESDFYWFHTGAGIFQVPTEQVKEWGRSPDVDHVWGGINRASKGFKLPVKWMEEFRIKDAK